MSSKSLDYHHVNQQTMDMFSWRFCLSLNALVIGSRFWLSLKRRSGDFCLNDDRLVGWIVKRIADTGPCRRVRVFN